MSTLNGGGEHGLAQARDAIADMLDDTGAPMGDAHVDRTKGQRTKREIAEDGGAVDERDEDDAIEEDSAPRRPRQEAEGEDAEEIGDESANTDEEEAAINSISDMAHELGMDPEDLIENLSHSFKASGKVETVTLSELVKGYQRQADYDRKNQTLAEARRAFEAEQQNRFTEYQRNAAEHAQRMQAVGAMLQQELQSPEMIQLQQTDPASYLIKAREIEGRQAQLEQQRQVAAQQFEQQRYAYLNQRTAQEAQALREKVPDWGEEKLGDAVEVIRSFGYRDEEFAQNPDHRTIMAALEIKALREKVAAFEAEQGAAKKTAKRVKEQVPNAPRPGKRAANGRVRVQRDRLSQAKKRLAKSAKTGGRSNLGDAASVIEQLI